jgi:hypothetical protein
VNEWYDVARLTIAGRAIREHGLGNARVLARDPTRRLLLRLDDRRSRWKRETALRRTRP